MINSPEGWFQRLIFRTADKSYVSLSFSVPRGHPFMSWLPLSLGKLATVFVLFTLWHISHVCLPANISANGYDKGVTRASPIIIRSLLTWNWSHHFSSLFLALTAWVEILADNDLTILRWSLDPSHRVTRVITAVLPLEWEVSKCCVVLSLFFLW